MTKSFDVFDTCLCRLCGDPRMLLDVLSWKVVDLMPLAEDDKEHLREQFVSLRADAHGDLGTVVSAKRASHTWPSCGEARDAGCEGAWPTRCRRHYGAGSTACPAVAASDG